MAEGADRTLTVLGEPLPPVARHRGTWGAAVALAAIAVYLASLSPHWRIGKDSGLYLNLARNLARGEGYTLAGAPHTCVPPGFPVMLAALMKIGAGSFLALNALMGLIGLAILLASYLLLRQLVHRDWALLMTGALVFSREMLQRSGEILSEAPFMLVVTTALWLYARGLRRRRPRRGAWEAASLLLVGGCWIRVAALPVALAAPVGLVLSAGRAGRRRALLNLAIVVAALLATALSFYAFYAANLDPETISYPGAIGFWSERYTIFTWLAAIARNFYMGSGHLSRLILAQRMPLPVCMVVLVVPVAIAMVRRVFHGDRLGPLAVAGCVGGLLPLELETRYLYPFLPLLLLYLMEGLAWLAGLAAPRRRPAGAVAAALGVLAVAWLMNLPLAVKDTYAKHRADYRTMQHRGHWKDSIAAAEFLRAHKPAEGAVIALQPIGYLADMPCPLLSMRTYMTRHSPEEVSALLRRWNVRFVVLDYGRRFDLFFESAKQHLEQSGEPVFTHGTIEIYAVDERGRAATMSAGGPPSAGS